MDPARAHPSRLLITSTVENRDDIEEKFERSYQFVQSLTGGVSDKDAHDALNNALVKEKGYEEVSLGLLVAVLTEPHNAVKAYRDLTLITRDGFGLVLNNLSQLVLERYLRFNDVAKSQLIWLVRELIKNSVTSVDTLCWNLMRHAAGGDTSARNIALIEALLDVYIDYRNWLERFPVLLQSVVYTYLRLIEDHHTAYLANLRQKEVTFIVSLLREKFFDCLVIGRDLVRLLQNVARIPEFDQLWKDMLVAPKQLCPSFAGILQLLQTRTSRRFLQSRLTPEMERKLVFLTSSVRFGNHKRYQEWFQRQYLATAESQSLRCDMIRFIVGVIHPTNELLCSDIIPRWAVIGWLLTTCTSNVAVSNAKLALFYDWLFYDSDKDNIMNIEPAILVMHHSMRSHPAVSATLLDFLCRIIANFYPPLTERVRTGIFSSLKQILDKRVLPSLLPLFDNAKLDRELRVMVRETFKEFCSAPVESSSKREDSVQSGDDPLMQQRLNHALNNHADGEPAFSDEEDEHRLIIHGTEEDTDDDDIPLAKVRLKERTQDRDGNEALDGPLRACVTRLQAEQGVEGRCEAMEALIEQVMRGDWEAETLQSVARRVHAAVEDDLREEIAPAHINDETLADSVRTPLFSVLRALVNACRSDDAGKTMLFALLAELYNVLPALGYLLLYFLKVHARVERIKEDQAKLIALRISVYKEYCHCIERKLDVCLYEDVNSAHVRDARLMLWLVPDLYRDFRTQMINNAQILRVIVSVVDARQLQDLVYNIVQGHLVMLKSDNLHAVVKSTLAWETIEQFFFWQLLQAHDISFEAIIGLVPYLEHKKHAEAITAVTLMLSQEQPTADYIKYLFSRDIRDDDEFTYSVIKCWCRNFIDAVSEFICNLINTRYPATSPNKRKRSGAAAAAAAAAAKSLSTTVPSADQVLGHLDLIRSRFQQQDYVQFFYTDPLQRGLQVAQSNSSDSQRKHFYALFSLIEEEDVRVAKGRSQGRGRKPAAAKGKRMAVKEVSESSEQSSEEEEMVKPKQAKKRKKVVSDSE